MRSVTIAAMMLVAAVTSAAGIDKAPGPGLPLAAPNHENSGAWLLERCEARNNKVFETGYCIGYISGVAGALGRIPFGYCPSSGVTRGQLMRVVIKYLQEHPEELHGDAAALTLSRRPFRAPSDFAAIAP
jgi:hypothetical protein